MAFWNIQHILNKIFDSATSALNIKVTGSSVAHDAPSTANPILTGFVAESTTPAAVADGDLSQQAGTLYGAAFVNLRTAAGGALALVNTDQLVVTLKDSAGDAVDIVSPSGDAHAVTNSMSVQAYMEAFNNTTHDRWRNNTEGTLLASAARTTSTSSADQTNYNASKLIVYLNITVVPGADTIAVKISAKDPVSGVYSVIRQSNTKSATGMVIIGTGSGMGALAAHDAFDVQLGDAPPPRVWRVDVTHSGAGSFTYSVGYALSV